ncbi:MAG: hypothetical protein ABIJ26_05290 [Candidatus Margulisiibacteriota bacterium]
MRPQERRLARQIHENRFLNLEGLFKRGSSFVQDVNGRVMTLQMTAGRFQPGIFGEYSGFPLVFRLFSELVSPAMSKVQAFLYCVIEPTLQYHENSEAEIKSAAFLRWRIDDSFFSAPLIGQSFNDFIAARRMGQVIFLNGLSYEEKMPPGLMVDFERRAEGLGTFLFAMAVFASRRIFHAEDFLIMSRENSDIISRNICGRLELNCVDGSVVLSEDIDVGLIETALERLRDPRIEIKNRICKSLAF